MNNEKNIHWFPGHMQKALRNIESRLKVVDLVIEIADARIPRSSRNPHLGEIIKNKKRLLIINKTDLADNNITKLWEEEFERENELVLFGNLNNNRFINEIKRKIVDICKVNPTKTASTGYKGLIPRVLVVGIPNSGKSTLINNLAGSKVAKVENKPGLTRAQQLINVENKFILIDTPGILPPNYEDEETVRNLALICSIRQDILPTEVLATYLLHFLYENYKSNLFSRFDIPLNLNSEPDIFLAIAERRGILIDRPDFKDRVNNLLLTEFRNGLFGPISLETPNAQ